MRVSWVLPEELLPFELVASRDEGRDVSAIAARWNAAGDGDRRAFAERLLDECDALAAPAAARRPVIDVGLSTREIGDHPGVDRPTSKSGGGGGGRGRGGEGGGAGAAADPDRIRGAWLGRAAGCLLGKPVEKVPREGIREILTATGRWPLADYFTAVGLPDEVAARWPWNRHSAGNSLVENITGMPEDDDLNYPLVALRVLETHGFDFTSDDVAQAWLDWLPAGRVFTAERVAYRNLLLGLSPPETARRWNPFREWIGAQIRTDVYGWVSSGRPAWAAELAWRDAVVSHTGAGVHGALWAAALSAAAVVASDVDTVLDAGELVLPAESPFAVAVREARAHAAAEPDWEAVVDGLYVRHGHLHWVHARNNAALVAAALAHGRGDYSRSICAVVSGGWDTDSNGATVGSVVGGLTGAVRLPPQWTEPLRDTLRTSLAGLDGVSFTELAARTVRVSGDPGDRVVAMAATPPPRSRPAGDT